MQDYALSRQTVSTLLYNLRKGWVEGVCESNVAHHTALEEGEGSNPLCAIDDLIRNDEVPRFDLFLQTAYRGEGDDGSYADLPQCGDVGAVGDFVRSEFMVEAVSGDEGDWERLAG